LNTFSFDEQAAAADTDRVRERVERFLRQRFPDLLAVRRAAQANDRIGADFVIEFPHGQFRFVDIKVRKTDFQALGQPDVALEVWSNAERQLPGWALDDAKLTDYTMFVWSDSGRIVMFDARALRAVTRRHLSRWQVENVQARQRTAVGRGSYTSSVIFVSSTELATLIARWQGVEPAAA
jgi:hypothetical protein